MQLRNARLCLDCEELHEAQQCPTCASESFAYLSRWIPAEERRLAPRQRPTSPAPPAGKRKWIAGGLAGVVVFAVSHWFLRSNDPSESGSNRPPSDEQ